MRELKFRVWNKADKHWLDYDEIFISQEGEVYEIEERSWAYQSYMHQENITEKVEIMQYTGLKDKNGKEIYEGDILSDYEEKPFYIEFSEEKSAFCFVDKFDPYGTEYYTVKDFHYEGLEIVGNIYQNPELLELR